MAFSTIVDVLYVIDMLYYSETDDSWGIGVQYVEFEKIKLLLP